MRNMISDTLRDRFMIFPVNEVEYIDLCGILPGATETAEKNRNTLKLCLTSSKKILLSPAAGLLDQMWSSPAVHWCFFFHSAKKFTILRFRARKCILISGAVDHRRIWRS